MNFIGSNVYELVSHLRPRFGSPVGIHWYAVVGAFFQIPLETFQKLYQSMYTQLIKVLESGGKRIKY